MLDLPGSWGHQTQKAIFLSPGLAAGRPRNFALRGAVRSRLGLFLLLLAAVFLLGCQTELYTGLSEEEANLMLSALLSRDIAAEKAAIGKNGYAISVDKKNVVRALDLLKTSGLPRPAHKNLGEVFSGQGMISTALEEQSRLAYALAQELSETFSKVDGVLTARVHVVLADHDVTGVLTTPASCSVFLRHLPESPAVRLTAKIKEVAAKAVPGLNEDKISVMLVSARPEVVLPEPVSRSGFKAWLIYPSGTVLLGLLAYGILRRLGYGFRKTGSPDSPQASSEDSSP
jgi:type III secretion protein J